MNNISTAIASNVYDQIWSQTWGPTWDSVCDLVELHNRIQISEQIRNPILSQVRQQCSYPLWNRLENIYK